MGAAGLGSREGRKDGAFWLLSLLTAVRTEGFSRNKRGVLV